MQTNTLLDYHLVPISMATIRTNQCWQRYDKLKACSTVSRCVKCYHYGDIWDCHVPQQSQIRARKGIYPRDLEALSRRDTFMSRFIEALSVTAKEQPPKSPRLHDDNQSGIHILWDALQPYKRWSSGSNYHVVNVKDNIKWNKPEDSYCVNPPMTYLKQSVFKEKVDELVVARREVGVVLDAEG